MHYVDYKLDEAYPFRISNNVIPLSKGFRLEIPVYGTATIAVSAIDDWHLSGLTLTASNGKYGDKCEIWERIIDGDDPLYAVVESYLENVAREEVEAEIGAYFAELNESRRYDEGKERAKLRGAA